MNELHIESNNKQHIFLKDELQVPLLKSSSSSSVIPGCRAEIRDREEVRNEKCQYCAEICAVFYLVIQGSAVFVNTVIPLLFYLCYDVFGPNPVSDALLPSTGVLLDYGLIKSSVVTYLIAALVFNWSIFFLYKGVFEKNLTATIAWIIFNLPLLIVIPLIGILGGNVDFFNFELISCWLLPFGCLFPSGFMVPIVLAITFISYLFMIPFMMVWVHGLLVTHHRQLTQQIYITSVH